MLFRPRCGASRDARRMRARAPSSVLQFFFIFVCGSQLQIQSDSDNKKWGKPCSFGRTEAFSARIILSLFFFLFFFQRFVFGARARRVYSGAHSPHLHQNAGNERSAPPLRLSRALAPVKARPRPPPEPHTGMPWGRMGRGRGGVWRADGVCGRVSGWVWCGCGCVLEWGWVRVWVWVCC